MSNVFTEKLFSVSAFYKADDRCAAYGLCPYCFLLPDKENRVEARLGVA